MPARKFDEAGVTLIDVSNGAKGQSTNFIDPEQTPQTIADHVALARDFLQPRGCELWKCNMGQLVDEPDPETPFRADRLIREKHADGVGVAHGQSASRPGPRAGRARRPRAGEVPDGLTLLY